MRFVPVPGVRGIGIGGAEYVVGADGTVDVPDEFTDVVLTNGFKRAPDAPVEPIVTPSAE